MWVLRWFGVVLLISVLAGCGGRSALPPRTDRGDPSSTVRDLLRPYKLLARAVPAAAPPIVNGTFDRAHSVDVPAAIARQAITTRDSNRLARDTVAEAYAMIAVASQKSPSSLRRVRDGETCYYLVTYLYNVRTGEVVAILDVRFQGCDSGSVGSDGGGGSGLAAPTPAPLPDGWQLGCNSSADSRTNERNTALTASAPQMNASMQSNQEAVNYIARNDVSGQYAIVPGGNYTPAANGGARIGAPPAAPAGWTLVAFTHTHPTNFGNTVDPTGVDSLGAGADPYVNGPGENYPAYTNTYFSVLDLAYANSNGLNAYVEVYSALSAVAVQAGNYTYNWGSWISGGTIGDTTNYNSGTMGAASTWPQC